MLTIFAFRIMMVTGFLLAAWKYGDRRNWHKYYPSMLFVMVVNLSAALISYHHQLWIFTTGSIVTSQTVVELISTYAVLPATALVYNARFPTGGIGRQAAYVAMWVAIYGALEYTDFRLGGITYAHGWSIGHSVVFDILMFTLIRIHHLKPPLAWLLTFISALFIITTFGYLTAEMK